eukprot:TRINITY_DN105972_c0_g1_i1.p1 TRINITY_DN105972_c0_g1~~TRINITY_DN105972_c0_g1_i1.p1  ORF type:complete len:731 (-),score=90.70 TRINITY_DN105972_c0_g1_i1:108-2300(-)
MRQCRLCACYAPVSVTIFFLPCIPALREMVSSAARVDEEVKVRRYEDHEDELVIDALSGEWDTDYHALWASWTKVYMEHADKSGFAFGEDRRMLHFSAKSHKFQGSEGSAGERLISVIGILGMIAVDQPVALLTQRMDMMSDVRHTGKLMIEQSERSGLRWVIVWSHGRKWWKPWKKEAQVNVTLDEHSSKQDKSAKAKEVSIALLRQWDTACRASSDVIETTPLNVNAQVGVSLGAGLNFAGIGGSADLIFCIDPQMTQRQAARLDCILAEMEQYTFNKSAHGVDQAAITSVVSKISVQLKQYLKPTMPAHCWPGICFEMSFIFLPYPPFIWPIPYLAVALNWPTTYTDIVTCGEYANVSEIVKEAYAMTEKSGGAKNEIERQSAFSISAEWTQGPNFGIFPFPASFGWWWSFDLSLAMSLRRIVKTMRQAGQNMLGHDISSKCEKDREEYFHQLAEWAMHGHSLSIDESPACARVRDRLDAIKNEHPEADYQRNPLRFSHLLEQLASDKYVRDDITETYLGGGYAYVGTDGFAVGIFQEVLDTAPSKKYHHTCKPFQDFVNTYQRSVVHAHADVVDDDDCDVNDSNLDLSYQSCRKADEEFDSDLPAYPIVYISTDGHLLNSTDSQCTRCASITSYGMPCNFCAKERLVTSHPTCRQFHGSFAHPPCTVEKVQVLSSQMDQLRTSQLDARWRCGSQGGFVRVLDAHGNVVVSRRQVERAKQRYLEAAV